MKIGVVGVGPHGRALAAAFQAEGAEIVGHYRISNGEVEGLGPRFHSFDETMELSDAVVLAAPPETTLTYALACATNGIPVLATKPLTLDAPIELKAPFYVDYWRLWHPCYLALKEAIATDGGIGGILINFSGNGPVRSFSGLLDYGSHVLAFLHDLLPGDLEIEKAKRTGNGTELYAVAAGIGNVGIDFKTGNGGLNSVRALDVQTKTGRKLAFIEQPESIVYGSDDGKIFVARKEQRLIPMVCAFMADVETRHIDPKWMLMSVQIADDLNRIRAAAG